MHELPLSLYLSLPCYNSTEKWAAHCREGAGGGGGGGEHCTNLVKRRAVCAGGVVLTFFSLVFHFCLLSPSLQPNTVLIRCCNMIFIETLSLLHSESPKLYTILDFLSAIRLRNDPAPNFVT